MLAFIYYTFNVAYSEVKVKWNKFAVQLEKVVTLDRQMASRFDYVI